MLVFALTWPRIHVSSGNQVAHDLVVGRYARLVRSNTICPIVECSVGEEYRPEAGHVILSPFGSSSIVVPKFFI